MMRSKNIFFISILLVVLMFPQVVQLTHHHHDDEIKSRTTAQAATVEVFAHCFVCDFEFLPFVNITIEQNLKLQSIVYHFQTAVIRNVLIASHNISLLRAPPVFDVN